MENASRVIQQRANDYPSRSPKAALHASESSAWFLRKHCPTRWSPTQNFLISASHADRIASRLWPWGRSCPHDGMLINRNSAQPSEIACFIHVLPRRSLSVIAIAAPLVATLALKQSSTNSKLW